MIPGLLLLCFALPFGLAYGLYHRASQHTFGTLNRGILITPVLHFRDTDTKTQSKWIMLYLTETPEPKITEKLHNIHLTLGKNFSRVQTHTFLYMNTENLYNRARAEMLLSKLPKHVEAGIFIIDPRGQVVMGYLPDADPSDIYKDLTRLLQYSNR